MDLVGTGTDDAQFNRANQGEIVVGGIRAVLEVPAQVERTHAFTARVTLTNTLSSPATWTSGMPCIAFLNVYRAGERVPLQGTDFGCLGVVTIRELAAGESLTTEWRLVAQTTDGTPLQPGTFTFEADPVIASQQTLRRKLMVR
jgi:hypothetical protein